MDEDIKLDNSLVETISGYRILRSLEEDRVFLATSLDDGHICALKLSSRESLEDSVFNLKREYVIHANFFHPNIVELGEAFEEKEIFGFILSYVGGGDLRKAMPELSRASIPLLLRDIALGLAHIHEKGFVHADIKPENILMSTAGVPKICDFGVARDLKTSRVDSERTIVGTTTYLSPEYIMWGQMGASMDIYALGMMMIELYIGHVPGEGLALMEMLKARDDIFSSSEMDLIPKGLKDLALKCVVKDPEKRIRDASQFLEGIITYIEQENNDKTSIGVNRRLRVSSDEVYLGRKRKTQNLEMGKKAA